MCNDDSINNPNDFIYILIPEIFICIIEHPLSVTT